MQIKSYLVVVGMALVMMIAGCDGVLDLGKSNTDQSGSVVMDLSAIIKATGQDEVIKNKIENANAQLNEQLAQSVNNFDQQLKDQRAKLGKKLSQEEEEKIQQLTLQANQQLQQLRMLAQKKSKQYETDLVMGLREKILPIATEVAQAKGATSIQLVNPSILWFDASIDITDEVISIIRAQGLNFDETESSSEEQNEASVDSDQGPETGETSADEVMPAEDMPAEDMPETEMPATEMPGTATPAESVDQGASSPGAVTPGADAPAPAPAPAQ